MKNELSIKVIIISFITAIFLALLITFYVGSFNEFTFSESSLNFYWNTLLINLTFMGDAFFAFGLIFFLIFFFNKKKIALNLFITILITLTITQLLKNLFSGLPPQLYFEEGVMQDSTNAIYNKNFISSHTAIIFTIAGFFVIYSRNTLTKIVLILLAVFVAFTRVKLVEDSIIALLLGILPAAVTVAYILRVKNKTVYSSRIYFYKSKKGSKINAQHSLIV
jgi:membrane-associated phospholipid phosphatase